MTIVILRLCFTPRDVCLLTSLRLYTCVGLVLRSCISRRPPGLTMKVTCFTPIMSFAILFHILCCVPYHRLAALLLFLQLLALSALCL